MDSTTLVILISIFSGVYCKSVANFTWIETQTKNNDIKHIQETVLLDPFHRTRPVEKYLPNKYSASQENPRQKRHVISLYREDYIFVANRSQGGDLFKLATDEAERFAFNDPAPDNLVIHPETGMVSRIEEWDIQVDQVDFSVNVTRVDNATYQEDQAVRIHLVTRGTYDPILSTEPRPLRAVVPTWIRPGIGVISVTAIDAQVYGAQVQYKIESGAEERFSIDADTGEIQVEGRAAFWDNEEYHLAVSANIIGSIGSASNLSTPAQVVTVVARDLPPQFYTERYDVDMDEETHDGTPIVQVQAKSFFDLGITYTIEPQWDSDILEFSINAQTGEISPDRVLKYVDDPRQYRMIVRGTEEVTDRTSTALVIVNLIDINNHVPYFPLVMYESENIPETADIGTTILELSVVDLDDGPNGEVSFFIDNDHFDVETVDIKSGNLIINSTLSFSELDDKYYEFQVNAIDQGSPPLTGSTTVRVWVTNENTNPPVFQPQEQWVYVKENLQINGQPVLVHVIQAYDPDGDPITFGVDEQHPLFEVDENGNIYLKEDLVGELEVISMEIKVTDGLYESTGTIKIDVFGVNRPPRFPDCSTYEPGIPEGPRESNQIINVTAEDADSGTNGELRYSIVQPSSGESYFDIEMIGDVAQVVSSVEFDREFPDYFTPGSLKVKGKTTFPVTVQAQDLGIPQMFATCFFLVTIEDINDHTPLFDFNDYDAFVPLDILSGDSVYWVFAHDFDEGENGRVTYSIDEEGTDTCDGSPCFNIHPTNGQITAATDISKNHEEELSVTVRATDHGDEPRSSTKLAKIHFYRTSSLPPQWDQNINEIEFEIPENFLGETDQVFSASPGTSYYYLDDHVAWDFMNSRRDFVISENKTDNNMQLAVVRSVAFTEVETYVLRLKASRTVGSSGTVWSEGRVRVHLTDENMNSPLYQGRDLSGQYPAYIADDSEIGTLLTTVYAVDLDGTSPNNEVRYFMQSECETCDDPFRIDEVSGEIFSLIEFDRDLTDEYDITVIARDMEGEDKPGARETPQQIIVTITGGSAGSPYFPGDEATSLDEGVPVNTTVLKVEAVDPDPGMNRFKYDIVSGNEDRMFVVEELTGRIYTTGWILHSQHPEFNLELRVFDGAVGNTTNVRITINKVNLFPPRFDPVVYISDKTITEEDDSLITIPGQVANVSAFDPDEFPDDLVYGLDGHHFIQDPNRFHINPATGQVTMGRPLSRDYPDGHANWQINAKAEDQNPISKTGYGIINIHLIDINDNDPIFDTCCIEGEVMENSGTNAFVMDLSAMDYDEGPNADVVYSLEEDTHDIFEVSPEGRITVPDGNSLDRETLDSYELVVKAQDQPIDEPPRDTLQKIWITIGDENDNAPVFNQSNYHFDMPEKLPIGASVGSVYAHDPDLLENAERTYTIPTGGDGDYFRMDSIYVAGTGVIKVDQTVEYEALPEDKTLSFSVVVQDPDDTHTATATVTLTVTDVNDPPVFNPDYINRTISEAAEEGAEVATFEATDPDVGDNAIFEYFIDYQHTDPLKNFQINQDGLVTIRNQLDRETIPLHTVHVLAIDKGEIPQTGTATLVVTVSDVNDNPPRFREDYAPWVYQNTPSGQTVVTIMVEDPDEPQNGPPFCIDPVCEETDPCASDLGFQFNGATPGDEELVVRAARSDGYVREKLGYSHYAIPIRMVNRCGEPDPSLTSTATLTIWIESINDTPHSAAYKHTQVYNYQRKLTDAYMGHVNVEDPNDGDRHDKRFSLTTENEYFRVAEEFGEIYMERGAPPGRSVLDVTVTDVVWTEAEANSGVFVDIMYVEDYHWNTAGTMRLSGTTAEEFIFRQKLDGGIGDYGDSKMMIFKNKMAELLGSAPENVDVFTVQDVSGLEQTIDIHYMAHGSPYYLSSRLDGIAWRNKVEIGEAIGATVLMAPLDFCMEETCWDSGCHNNRITSTDPLLVNTNATSLVGVDVSYEVSCKCEALDFSDVPTTGAIKCQSDSCLNGGTCHETWSDLYCECPELFDGPWCQQLKVSFNGDGWGWYPPLEQCEDAAVSFEFITQNENGLLLYNGPMYDPPTTHNILDFIAVQLSGGYPRLLVNLGEGTLDMTVDGQDSNGATQLDPLNDGRWHTIEIFKKYQTIRMVVDHCDVSEITEDIDGSSEDRDACEVEGTLEGEHFLLNVYTPLQLGGRAETNPVYPPDVTTQGFNGCIANLRHNGILYDLHLGEVGGQENAVDGCSRDGCEEEQNPCLGNSTCVGSFTTEPACICLPGFRGDDCDIETTIKDFPGDDSFIEWQIGETYNQTTDIYRKSALQIMFRTRDPNGFLFHATSFSTLERMIVELRDTHPQLRYDMGAGDIVVAMQYVNASDGMWHILTIYQYGNQIIMKMDGGEGRYYAESWPEDAHRLIILHDRWTALAANVYYRKYHELPVVEDGIENACMNDVRFQEVFWFPMAEDEGNDFAVIEKEEGTLLGCDDWDSCGSITCSYPSYCLDVWRLGICVCPANMTTHPEDICVDVNDCDIYNPCINGDCVINKDDELVCHCWDGWGGEFCESEGGTTAPRVDKFASLSDAAMIIILMCLFLVLVLLLIFIVLSKREQRPAGLLDDSFDDYRENVVFYEEEGVGEEDETGYDIVPLRKPVDEDSMEKIPIDPYGAPDQPYRREVPVTTAAEPMTAPRHPYAPGPDGKYPDIGDFINDHLGDANDDPNAPPFDSLREYQYEGSGSSAGTLSSLQSSSTGDQDYDYLNDWGPRFQRLADLYGEGDENTSDV